MYGDQGLEVQSPGYQAGTSSHSELVEPLEYYSIVIVSQNQFLIVVRKGSFGIPVKDGQRQ
jgi:hypothetical protein